MSKAFHPPDSLSKEDRLAMANLRRDVWTSGFKGLFYGSASGFVLHTTARFLDRYIDESTKKKIIGSSRQIKFNRNTVFLSVLLGGALGSFTGATVTGKNEVHNLHRVMEKGKKDTSTPYQQTINRAKEKELEGLETRKTRRMVRRQTIAKHLEEGNGLSDSHGGHWLDETDSDVK